jgi:hypothetical protein
MKRSRCHIIPLIGASWLGFLLLGCLPVMGYAQLISPGKLSKPHAFLDGLSNCTSCHELGTKGVINTKCLDCHTPIQETIEAQLGLHGQADVIDQNCASCHKEHFGEQFDQVRLDTLNFDHLAKTGFELIGKHIEVNCSSCHAMENVDDATLMAFRDKYDVDTHTYLGMGSDCESCHLSDSPHEDQFVDMECQSCHTPEGWDELSKFDHDQTAFALTGKHQTVECASCHEKQAANGEAFQQYTGLAFDSCTDCHEDQHDGQLSSTCTDCHQTQGWHQFAGFPEQSYPHRLTGFALVGAHANADCQSCHGSNNDPDYQLTYTRASQSYTYPHPLSEECESCHVDVHDGAFQNASGITECESCHNNKAFYPTDFGIAEHNKRTDFALTGAHLATPCFACHSSNGGFQPIDQWHFAFDDQSCEGCHAEDNPHEDSFTLNGSGQACESCHDTKAWDRDITFDHSKTAFALTGAHSSITCTSCHEKEQSGATLHLRFDTADQECVSCHQPDNPHHGQFMKDGVTQDCASCHDTEAFTIAAFDHDKTQFPLDGAHSGVSCRSCHQTEQGADGEAFVRFKPLSTKCESCHGDS